MAEVLKLNSLPLFPLGTVLYPGGLLPLQIFEVRYLDMIGKCHKAGAPFGIISLTEGSEVRRPNPTAPGGDGFAQEAFGSVGTLASITEFSVPQPGLMMIRCVGTQRFEISAREKLKHGLWIANVTRLDGDQSVAIPEDLQRTADALGKLIKSLQERRVPEDQMPLLAPYQLDDCGWVANRWCELLPMPLELKQRLMELDNPLVRLELVSDILDRTGIAL
ncbi:MAG: peptidase S16 [Polaromonas sp. 39-63-203]|uniref:LON peptidase substrate-binding domain-containing protein n=1 Tax=Polaromonas sp. TaxID=1869339 RepID=UPI000BC381D0|nr:LON peptidase substrate-binding domain-containing protein [Polaromonas sp.]OYY53840.1 MAG: peptidase S16 [Polaromonas sp. 35-63-240]OYY95158.1 MAG: peptidase S16 [Polaromonas sp. 28-63-22]OYZ84886.1 MAG: peptidase S16 [Polaromonas sp. 24-62-144]OZB02264.1 MAG: peptidase S16 [Polaromonas sp. 39-63-203]HQS33176.1 LON peptidase substrate-binding domain-containing protein [Polaromonas sp.]